MGVGKSRGRALRVYVKENYQLYLLLLPAVVFIFIFCYVPMYGAQIAFRDYKIRAGYWGSEWVGLKHFARFVTSNNFWPLLRNTLGISLYSLIAGFPVPILLAFMLNELPHARTKKVIQMILYAPHFISMVAICGLIHLFLRRESGIINLLRMALLGVPGKDFLSDPAWFKTIYVVSGIWQSMGWGTIIYMAALAAVDPEIIEAAYIDGASRMQKIRYVDFPSILPTVVVLLILNAGSLLNVGYEKILLLQNAMNMQSSDVISTYVYRLGIQDAQYSYTTAIGLFNALFNVIILVTVNKISGAVTETSLW